MSIRKMEWWQLNLRRRILQFHQVAAELQWDKVLMRMKRTTGLSCSVLYWPKQSKVDKKYFIKSR